MLPRIRLLLQYGWVSVLLFMVEVLVLAYLLKGFWGLGTYAWQHVFLAFIGTNLVLLLILGLQAIGHRVQKLSRTSEAQLEAWTEVWLGLIWDEGGEPRLGKLSALQSSAAFEALLTLRERLRGVDSYRAAQWYQRSGLLNRDLELLTKGTKDERLVILERLARARHPSSIFILEQLFKSNDPEMQRLTLLCLARVFARLKRPADQLVRRFYQKLASPLLSRGTVERTLVLLEKNAAAVIEAILEPSARPHPQIQSALEALGHVKAIELADLAAYWLRSENLGVRCAAARALFRLGVVPAQAESALRTMLLEPDFAARAQAVLALSCVNRNFVNQVLMRCLGDPHWWVRHNSAVALAKRGLKGFELLERAAVAHSDAFARDIARQQLIEMGTGVADTILV